MTIRYFQRLTQSILILVLAGCSGDQGPESYGVQLSPPTLSLTLGGATSAAAVTATVTRKGVVDNSVPVSWITSDAGVATVTSAGQVATITGTGHGNATITATVPGGTATAAVNVVAPVCVFESNTPAVTSGITLTAVLSMADCRLSDAPAKVYQLAVPVGPHSYKIVLTSQAFGPKLSVYVGSSTTPRSDNGVGNTACVNESILRGPTTYFIVVTPRSGNATGSFTLNVQESAQLC